MKMIKVFVTPVVLMLFVLLPTMLHAAQEGINLRIGDDNDIGISGDKQERRQQGEVDHPMNESYGSSMDIFHTMVGKNPHQMYEDSRHQTLGRDGMLNMGLQNPANHQLLTKSSDRKSDAASAPLGTWKIEAVDASKNFTTSNSRAIVVDAGNHPHIFYGGDHLYHAYHDGSKWNYETVDSSSGVGNSASVARDTSGKVHICYFDAINQVLKYATNKLGFWIVTNVDSNPGDVNNPTISIALDTSGKVHICYSYNKGTGSERDLNYVTNVTGKWVTEIIVPNILGSYSLAGGTSGKAHISYYDAINQDLMYVTNASGSWVTETVDSSGRVGVFNSLAVDTSGNVHISYSDNTNGDLKYATNASGSWVPEMVDSSGAVGALNSLALDTSGKVHISYYDGTNQDLKYVTNGSGS